MAFKKFENINKKLEDVITVTKTGSIGFPKFFYTKNSLKDFSYVTLFYDEELKIIAIQFTSNEAEKSKIRILPPSKDGYGASIIARSFFKTYGLESYDYFGKYNYKIEEIEGIGKAFTIQLKKKEIEVLPNIT